MRDETSLASICSLALRSMESRGIRFSTCTATNGRISSQPKFKPRAVPPRACSTSGRDWSGIIKSMGTEGRSRWWFQRALASLALTVTAGIGGTSATANPNANADFYTLAAKCAPSVAPEIMAKIVKAESGFNPYAIGVNGSNRRSYLSKTKAEAIETAIRLIAAGESIDMGLGQINSKNLKWLNLTPHSVFDSCTNLRASETVLRYGYEKARAAGADPERALTQALSAYNTGSFTRGVSNGYVARVMGSNASNAQLVAVAADKPETPNWDVYLEKASTTMVFE